MQAITTDNFESNTISVECTKSKSGFISFEIDDELYQFTGMRTPFGVSTRFNPSLYVSSRDEKIIKCIESIEDMVQEECDEKNIEATVISCIQQNTNKDGEHYPPGFRIDLPTNDGHVDFTIQGESDDISIESLTDKIKNAYNVDIIIRIKKITYNKQKSHVRICWEMAVLKINPKKRQQKPRVKCIIPEQTDADEQSDADQQSDAD